jgi:LuxR family maltose regulon positive regulatory protein
LEVVNTTFSNEIEQLPEDFILVLDDYHTIHGMEVHNLLNDWARHWPKPMHLVLISRISPPIPLDNLRAKGMISEIRTHELRFTAKETAAYLVQSQSVQLSQPALELLEKRCEGWIAGLHLAALSLRSTTNQETILMAISGENANITGYLVDEVLTHQFLALQTFLKRTSILERLCPSLCEAVIGEVDPAWNGRACLDWIERAELFITPLDNRREWYRYHQLFRELLQQRLSAEMATDQVGNLHRLASTWFEEHGLLDEALHHALSAGDLDLAAHQMYAGLRDVLNREDRPTLERWLRLLPADMIHQRPELLMIKVWSLQFLWRHDLQARVLKQVEELLDSKEGTSLPAHDLQILRGQILLPKAQYAYFNNQATLAIELCQQVLRLLPPAWTFVRGGAMIYLGLSMQASGQTAEAERLLLDEYQTHADKADIYALFVLQSLCFIYFNTGRLGQTRQIAQVLVQGATRSGIGLMKSWGEWFLGLVDFHQNELESAEEYFSRIFNNRYIAQVSPLRDAIAGLALIHQIHGVSSEGSRLVETISQFDLEQRGSEDNRTRSLRARLLLMQGDLEGAGQWADFFSDPPPDQALLWLEEPQMTRVRVLLTRGTDADLRLALHILDVLNEITERTHNTRFKIEILALRALAMDAQGEISKAQTELKQAIDLARLGGFILIFVDLGKSMQKMLQKIATQDHHGELIFKILAAFPEEDKNLVGVESPTPIPNHSAPGISNLAESLTPRELEVLALLREPLSIKEIASKLNISYATVKRHTNNIYGKLDVNQRWKAVARGEELGILPSR